MKFIRNTKYSGHQHCWEVGATLPSWQNYFYFQGHSVPLATFILKAIVLLLVNTICITAQEFAMYCDGFANLLASVHSCSYLSIYEWNLPFAMSASSEASRMNTQKFSNRRTVRRHWWDLREWKGNRSVLHKAPEPYGRGLSLLNSVYLHKRIVQSCGKKRISLLLPQASVHHTSNFRGSRFTQMKSGDKSLIFISPGLNEETCWWERAFFIPLSTKDTDWPFTWELM